MNTLGIATDLSLLAFAADSIPEDAAGRTFMLIASLESFGYLVGVGVLYPIYQWSLEKGSWAGGTAYYICAVGDLIPSHAETDQDTDFVRSCRSPHLAAETGMQCQLSA